MDRVIDIEGTIHPPVNCVHSYAHLLVVYRFEVNDYSGNEHCGTHMDAPSHFYKDNWPIGDIPVERFIAPAVVIDISARASTNSDAQLLLQDILDWENNHGKIPAGAVVFMYSAWGAKWPDKVAYYNSSTYNDTSTIHFPGIHPDATQWLVDNRDIVGLGVDTMSIDYAQSSDYMTHRIAYKQNIYGLEGVANLNLLPPAGATIYAMPMKIGLGSAAPCRIIATLPDSMSNAGIRMNCKHHFLAALLIIAQILVYLN